MDLGYLMTLLRLHSYLAIVCVAVSLVWFICKTWKVVELKPTFFGIELSFTRRSAAKKGQAGIDISFTLVMVLLALAGILLGEELREEWHRVGTIGRTEIPQQAWQALWHTLSGSDSSYLIFNHLRAEGTPQDMVLAYTLFQRGALYLTYGLPIACLITDVLASFSRSTHYYRSSDYIAVGFFVVLIGFAWARAVSISVADLRAVVQQVAAMALR